MKKALHPAGIEPTTSRVLLYRPVLNCCATAAAPTNATWLSYSASWKYVRSPQCRASDCWPGLEPGLLTRTSGGGEGWPSPGTRSWSWCWSTPRSSSRSCQLIRPLRNNPANPLLALSVERFRLRQAQVFIVVIYRPNSSTFYYNFCLPPYATAWREKDEMSLLWFKPTWGRVALDWDLWRKLSRLTYSAAATKIIKYFQCLC